MAVSDYRLNLVLRRDGVVLGDRELTAATAVEDALFRSVVAGDVDNDGVVPPIELTPRWHELGEPIISGFDLGVAGTAVRSYKTDIYADQARALTRWLVADGKIDATQTGSPLRWHVEAEHRPRRSRARVVRKPFPLVPGRLEAAEPDAAPGSWTVALSDDVLAEIEDDVMATPLCEVAGLLVGRVVHDVKQRMAQVQIGRYVVLPAGDGGASHAHFDFGPTTFQSARRALRELAPDATCTGWAHSHPACEGCPANPECRAQTVFFSEDDLRVHSSSFGAPFQVALVAGKISNSPASRPGCAVFGWDHGAIETQRFDVAGRAGGARQIAMLASADDDDRAAALPPPEVGVADDKKPLNHD